MAEKKPENNDEVVRESQKGHVTYDGHGKIVNYGEQGRSTSTTVGNKILPQGGSGTAPPKNNPPKK